jgi:hypothetical protein
VRARVSGQQRGVQGRAVASPRRRRSASGATHAPSLAARPRTWRRVRGARAAACARRGQEEERWAGVVRGQIDAATQRPADDDDDTIWPGPVVSICI